MFMEDRKPVLHVVDAGTTFQAVTFLEGEDAVSMWNEFLGCWYYCIMDDRAFIAFGDRSTWTLPDCCLGL
jgi:hypothetical protein